MTARDRNAGNDPQAVWRDFRAYLAYERDEGRVRIPVAASTRERLQAWSASQGPRHGAPTPAVRPPDVTAPPSHATAGSPEAELDDIARQIAACTACGLARTRTRTVPGHGNPRPRLMFIGEAPGEEEDRQGLPFVGRSGALLTRMLQRLGLSREEVFIANILKCRPPGNRRPTPAEQQTCRPFLERQIRRLSPSVIVVLGSTALHGLLKIETPISKARGVWHAFHEIPVMPTYHPSYLLRNLNARFDTWNDMLMVLDRLGLPHPPKNGEGTAS